MACSSANCTFTFTVLCHCTISAMQSKYSNSATIQFPPLHWYRIQSVRTLTYIFVLRTATMWRSSYVRYQRFCRSCCLHLQGFAPVPQTEAFSCFNYGSFGRSAPEKRQRFFFLHAKTLRLTLHTHPTSYSTYSKKSSRRGDGDGGVGCVTSVVAVVKLTSDVYSV